MNNPSPNFERNENNQTVNTGSTNTLGKEWKEGSNDISLEQIAFVRAINEIEGIDINQKGEIILPNLANRTKGKIPRLTTHTAINHLVESHTLGSWFVPEVTVIMPGQQTVEENGNPQNLRHPDSFWYGDLKVPEGSTLVWKKEVPDKFKGNKYKKELET